ncbi:hypothetical protein [Actinoallomurus sp. CA-150999]|uniref:hypothetical protein n=1 Tax=Actinoallomurus sp. CA-150999 TaxID=3239887 RepID=UPI003D91AF2D
MESAAERVSTALSCMAVDDRLSGILFFDMAPGTLVTLAREFAHRFGRRAAFLLLTAGSTEEGLWSTLDASVDGLGIVPGRLAGAAQVVAVPDLARVSIAAKRAAVATLGADVAHLERDGVSMAWHPRARWLAACSREDASRVSAHLLDRFALRIDAAGLREGTRGIRMPAYGHSGGIPDFPPAAASRVTELAPAGTGARRDLALARIARALAGLRGLPAVTPADVDAAARLIGLAIPGPSTGAAAAEPIGAEPAGPERSGPEAAGPEAAERYTDIGREAIVRESVPVVIPDRAESLPAGPVEEAPSPYPEDETGGDASVPLSVLHEPDREGRAARGAPVGTTRTLDVRDIAVVPTLLVAARFQRIRCPGHFAGPPHRPHLSAADLRAYRRVSHPARLLVLVLDHTTRRNWYPAVAPYLRWAYSVRSTVCVVEVGAAGEDELRARLFATRSLLDPRVADAMERPPGHATPLAHGLVLANEMLRSAMDGESLLLVVTDGRGNVPLSASLAGRIEPPVTTQGVDDALEVAGRIRELRRVRSVVIDPGPRPQASLTRRLADALGADLRSADEPAADLGGAGA